MCFQRVTIRALVTTVTHMSVIGNAVRPPHNGLLGRKHVTSTSVVVITTSYRRDIVTDENNFDSTFQRANDESVIKTAGEYQAEVILK